EVDRCDRARHRLGLGLALGVRGDLGEQLGVRLVVRHAGLELVRQLLLALVGLAFALELVGLPLALAPRARQGPAARWPRRAEHRRAHHRRNGLRDLLEERRVLLGEAEDLLEQPAQELLVLLLVLVLVKRALALAFAFALELTLQLALALALAEQ